MSGGYEDDAGLKFPLLIGDIGGTRIRFALLADRHSPPEPFPVGLVAEYASVDDAIGRIVLDRASQPPLMAVLAVAGPVDGDEIAMTNCNWVVRPRAMLETCDLSGIVILNDFVAQALAAVASDGNHMEKIGGGAGTAHGNRVVLGPGTGLGAAGLVYACRRWIPVAGEGGHMDMGPRTPRDYRIFPHLQTIDGRISGEQVLCGRGLVNVYNAIAAVEGQTPRLTTPAAITAAAIEHSDRLAEETLDFFVTCLGRIAGDLALVFMSRGGVFLTGGIAQKIVPALKTGRFRQAFEDKAPYGALVRSIPVQVMTDPLSGLAGLAAWARDPSRFGVELQGRTWTRGQDMPASA